MTTATKPIHGAPKPKNVPADMVDTPPIPCPFKVGDEVIYTNDYGVKFRFKVRGFTRELHEWNHGRFVYIFTDCWWFPADPAQMRFPRPDDPPYLQKLRS